MTNEKKYNGWANYESWNVALWLDNERASCTEMHQVAADTYNDAVASSTFSKVEQATITLADRIRQRIEDGAPNLGASCYADILSAALGQVDWREIAEHYIDDLGKDGEN